VICFPDNAPVHKAKPVKDTLETLESEILTHAAYSLQLVPSDLHLFESMGYELAEEHVTSYENTRKWINNWFASKDEQFYGHGIHALTKR